VHGLLLDNHSSFYMSIAPGIAKHARVVLYDLRGHGRSDQPRAGYRVDDMVEDLAGLVAAVAAGERVVVVGHSFGGTIALRYALRHPARVVDSCCSRPTGLAGWERWRRRCLLTGDARDAKIVELRRLARAARRARAGRRPRRCLDRRSGAHRGRAGDARSPAVSSAGARVRWWRPRSCATNDLVADIRATTLLADAELARVALPGARASTVSAPMSARAGARRWRARCPRAGSRSSRAEHGVLFQATASCAITTVAWLARGMR
jgi:pimeloyl-ACP methyl ester carboxylesterase